MSHECSTNECVLSLGLCPYFFTNHGRPVFEISVYVKLNRVYPRSVIAFKVRCVRPAPPGVSERRDIGVGWAALPALISVHVLCR